VARYINYETQWDPGDSIERLPNGFYPAFNLLAVGPAEGSIDPQHYASPRVGRCYAVSTIDEVEEAGLWSIGLRTAVGRHGPHWRNHINE
jgi:hypothetical protein